MKTPLTTWIGEEVEIETSKNKSQNKIKGKVIDETKNTLKIKTNQGTKTIIKNQVKLRKWKKSK